MKRKRDKPLSDADQIRIWKAVIVLSDARMRWPRALAKAIRMIEQRDKALGSRR